MSDAGSRIAANTAIRGTGEIIGKLASLGFYVMIARELGDEKFGDFIFGLSLGTVLLSLAGLGTAELITREIAKDHSKVDAYFADTMAFKSLFTVLLLALLAVFLTITGYPAETQIAVMLIALGVGIELLTQVPYAVFMGHERMGYTALSLVIQRTFTAVVGIVALIAGVGLIAVSVIFVAGSLVGLLTAMFWMTNRVVSPSPEVRRQRWMTIVRSSFPLGLVAFLFTIVLKADITLLSLLTDGADNNSEVGQYGAAFRLIEATFFIGWSLSAATLPWLSRDPEEGGIGLGRGYALSAKGLLAIIFPIAVFYGLLAEPMIDLLYGDGYEQAVGLLQILAPMAALFGWNTFVATVLIARNIPGGFTIPAVIVLVQNVVMNLILIPEYGAEGAAISSVTSGVFLAVLTYVPTLRAVGSFSLLATLTAPAIAACALTGAALAVGTGGLILPLIAGTVAFAIAFLIVERLFFADDFKIYRSLFERLRNRTREPADHPPVSSELGV